MKNAIATCIAILVLLVVGCSATDPTSSEEYRELEGDLAAAQQQLSAVSAERGSLAAPIVVDEANEPAVTNTTNPPTTTTEPAVPAGLALEAAVARAAGDAFDFAENDLCEWFTTDEILEIVAEAYAVKGRDYPIPAVLVTGGDLDWKSLPDRAGCDWAVPGPPGGSGRPDFAVMFEDDSDWRMFTDTGRPDGPTNLEVYKQDVAAARINNDSWPDWPGSVDPDVGDALVAGGVFPGSGWSPGFYFYVESQDRIIDFRHDLAARQSRHEDSAVEALIVQAMLERMNWLATPPD